MIKKNKWNFIWFKFKIPFNLIFTMSVFFVFSDTHRCAFYTVDDDSGVNQIYFDQKRKRMKDGNEFSIYFRKTTKKNYYKECLCVIFLFHVGFNIISLCIFLLNSCIFFNTIICPCILSTLLHIIGMLICKRVIHVVNWLLIKWMDNIVYAGTKNYVHKNYMLKTTNKVFFLFFCPWSLIHCM